MRVREEDGITRRTRTPLRGGAGILVVTMLAALTLPTFSAAVSAPVAAASGVVPAARYAVVDLGPLPTRTIDDKPALSEDGAAALWRVVASSTLHTELVRAGEGPVDLGSLPGHPNTIATGMNGTGAIVGIAQALGDLRDTQAFAWHDGKIGALPTLGGQHATARAINRAGQVAGSAQTARGELKAVRWEGGEATALSGPAGWGFSEAFAISEGGDVVGDADVARDGKRRAALWTRDGAHDLGTLAGGAVSSARAINARGQVVGFSDAAENDLHAVMWLPGEEARDLGSLGSLPAVALDINDAGQVVGASGSVRGPPQAFLWEDDRMTPLGALVAPDTGWRFVTAYRINRRGDILGHGFLGGESRAFLLRSNSCRSCAGSVAVDCKAGGARCQ